MRPPVVRYSDVMKRATLHIKVRVVRDWRYRLGLWFFRLGAAVLRCKLRIESDQS